ncbi:MAG: tetratricopeptide repeat protein [Actinomycetia bacterium]|nr:tetratricopeptide repeat protein [Actinomycetes bacterium]MCP4960726.1 tetratricopeptide repeat protein [Actinomycetes bacterium]
MSDGGGLLVKRRQRLIAQRDELLVALDRLDEELARGLIDEVDHATLSDDLTRRTARVLRRLDDVDPTPRHNSTSRLNTRTVVIIGVVVAAAAGLGLVVASFAGVRGSGGATGDIALSSRDYLVQAENELSQGLIAEAVESVDEALALSPDDPDALVLKGRVLFQAGDAVGALQLYEQALTGEPDHFDALVQKGRLFVSIPDEPQIQQQGIELLDRAIAQDPLTFEAHMLRASAAVDIEDDPEAAISYYEGVLDRNPPEAMKSVVEGLITDLVALLDS